MRNVMQNNLTTLEEVYKSWPNLSDEEKSEAFYNLDRDSQDELFLRISPNEQYLLLKDATLVKTRSWLRTLEPDDLVDLLQLFPEEDRPSLVNLLDNQMKLEINALLAYQDDVAGGLMNTRFARLRPSMTVQEALKYLRAQTMSNVETIYYAYVLSHDQKLVGVVSLRQLFSASPEVMVRDLMVTGDSLVTIQEGIKEEKVAHVFSQWSFLAIPVVD